MDRESTVRYNARVLRLVRDVIRTYDGIFDPTDKQHAAWMARDIVKCLKRHKLLRLAAEHDTGGEKMRTEREVQAMLKKLDAAVDAQSQVCDTYTEGMQTALQWVLGVGIFDENDELFSLLWESRRAVTLV